MSDIDTFREQVTQALDGISPRPTGHLTGRLWLGNTLVWSADDDKVTLVDIVKATQVPRWYDVRLIFGASATPTQDLLGMSEAFIAALQMAYAAPGGKHVLDCVDRQGARRIFLIDTRDLVAAHIQPAKS